MRRTLKRALLVGMTAGMVAATVGCVAPPLTYPLLLAAPEDATAEIQALLGAPPPLVQDSGQLASQVASKLVHKEADCELFPFARVISRTPGAPTKAAIELRIPCDDSVAGTWYELTITGDDQAGWVIALATKQSICKRGVSGALCV